MDNTDLIEAYLNNELLGDVLLSFEKRIDSEPELAEEVSLHRQIRGFVKENEVANLKSVVKTWLQEEDASPLPSLEARETSTQSSSNIFTLNLLAKIAAGIAVVAGLSWYFFSNTNSQNLEIEYLTALTIQNPPQLQGADDRAVWAQAYCEKKYNNVINFLEKKTNETPEEVYYLGLSFAAVNQNENALKQFSQKIIIESVYAEKAEWAKALIYLKLNNKNEAKQLLNKIKKSDSEFNQNAKLIDL